LGLHVVTPSGSFDVSPTQQADVFWATIGGMGLTGIITKATLKLLPIVSDRVVVDTLRCNDLDTVMDEMMRHDNDYRYSVAWVDCMTKGASLGRAILTRGDHAPVGAAPSLIGPKAPRLKVPFFAPSGLLNPVTIRTFNEAWFRRAPKQRSGELQSFSSFFHPLDGVSDWNRLYGKRGFVQYQFVVPDNESDTVRRAIELLSSSGVPSFLAVLKRFGAANPSPLSFPLPGWTLALDMPVGPRALPETLDQLDDLVVAAGGRIYLAKDSRLDPSKVRAMYPRLDEFLAVKERVDPSSVLASDLSRRLQLLKR
jgi:decaprenylphospho-beta-D-ribofuranose 2-oxidase